MSGGIEYIFARDLAELIRFANIEGITKKSYIDIIKQGETLVLLYERED